MVGCVFIIEFDGYFRIAKLFNFCDILLVISTEKFSYRKRVDG